MLALAVVQDWVIGLAVAIVLLLSVSDIFTGVQEAPLRMFCASNLAWKVLA